jgi:DNA-binding PadR family transcriptional regulator
VELTAASVGRLGRYVEPAIWVLVALDGGPRTAVGLLDGVRSLDGPIGPGTLFGAIARLEHLRLVDSGLSDDGRRAYHRTASGAAVASAAGALDPWVGEGRLT